MSTGEDRRVASGKPLGFMRARVRGWTMYGARRAMVKLAPAASIAGLAVALAGCGSDRDHTAAFVACLTRHGGIVARTPRELTGLAWRDAESGGGSGLPRLV